MLASTILLLIGALVLCLRQSFSSAWCFRQRLLFLLGVNILCLRQHLCSCLALPSCACCNASSLYLVLTSCLHRHQGDFFASADLVAVVAYVINSLHFHFSADRTTDVDSLVGLLLQASQLSSLPHWHSRGRASKRK